MNLFDLDPSRVLGMLHHQSWIAEEALRNRGLFTPPKEFPPRLGDFFGKDIYAAHHLGPHGGDLKFHETTATSLTTTTTTTTSTSTPTINTNNAIFKASQQQQQPLPPQQQQQYKSNSFNVRYPSMAAYFQHQQQQQQHASNIPTKQQQHEQHKKQLRQNTPSPVATTTTTTNNNLMATKTASPIPKSPLSMKSSHGDLLLEELQRKSEANDLSVSLELASPKLDKNHNNNNMLDNNNKSHTFTSGATLMSPGPGYKETLDQFLQRRRSSSASILVGDNLRNYSQLLLSSSSAATSLSCTDTSSCKEKSSSSSTSSTPPPTSALLAQHQHLSQMLKSPSDASLFGEVIEEETRCIVCNAHFPNVWLLEQHAALQHPHVGPGEEKPFICEQCGQSYRYRSAYAKHKEQNHRARLPADKLFTCDVCGMQFRYLKSFKKHRLNHALERLHGKKSLVSNSKLTPSPASFGDHDIVTSSQEPMSADDGVIEDLRIKIKRERDQREDEDERDEEQDNTVDSAGINMTTYNDNSSASASTNATESNITSSDVIYSTNKKHRLLTHSETDPSYQCLQQQVQQTLPPLPPQSHMHAGLMNAGHQHQLPVPISVGGQHHAHAHSSVTATAASLSSLNSLSSITSLINADRIPSEQFLGLNPQEASILNFLRVDAAERQRDKRPQASRFACPFCGKCVRSKENLKLHVRKHTGERPFVCLFCGRAFGGKSDLTRHLRIHTGERPYHCESCGKCFARADYLSKHLTTHIHNAPR